MINVASLVARCFSIVGGTVPNVRRSSTFTHLVTAAYDPSAGTIAKTDVTADVQAILGNFATKEIDGEKVRMGDRRILIQAAELVGISEVSLNDFITDGDLVKWEIIGIVFDSTKSVYIFHGRALAK